MRCWSTDLSNQHVLGGVGSVRVDHDHNHSNSELPDHGLLAQRYDNMAQRSDCRKQSMSVCARNDIIANPMNLVGFMAVPAFIVFMDALLKYVRNICAKMGKR